MVTVEYTGVTWKERPKLFVKKLNDVTHLGIILGWKCRRVLSNTGDVGIREQVGAVVAQVKVHIPLLA